MGITRLRHQFVAAGFRDQQLRGRGVFLDLLLKRLPSGSSATISGATAPRRRLSKFFAPTNDKGLSFLGVLFDDPVVKRVRIEYGNRALGPTDGGAVDVAVTDDFIYGEPQPQD